MHTRPRKRLRGASALEFALTFPVFIMLVGGMIDFGWYFYHQASLDSAVHLGCRRGVTRDPGLGLVNLADVETDAAVSLLDALNANGLECDSSAGCVVDVGHVGAKPSLTMTCAATLPFSPLMGLAPEGAVSSRTSMRFEFQR